MTLKVLALDLESTLITNVINRKARPGLREFLRFSLDNFEKVVIFTGTCSALAESVFTELDDARLIPEDFLDSLEIVDWEGWHKDLRFIEGYQPDEILIVDDFVDYIKPEQKDQWIRCRPYLPDGDDRWIESRAHPPDADDPDQELQRIQKILEERLGD